MRLQLDVIQLVQIGPPVVNLGEVNFRSALLSLLNRRLDVVGVAAAAVKGKVGARISLLAKNAALCRWRYLARSNGSTFSSSSWILRWSELACWCLTWL